MLSTLAGLLILTIFLYEWYIRSRRAWRMLRSQFPGVFPLPLVGNMLQVGATPEVVHTNLYNLWKKFKAKNFLVIFGSDPILMITEPDDVKIILGATTDVRKSDLHLKIIGEHFGDGIVNSSGNKNRVIRKILTPSFNFQLLNQYLDIANREGNLLIQHFQSFIDQPARDVMKSLQSYSINVIFGAAMGADYNGQSEVLKKFIESCDQILSLYIRRQYSAIYRYDFLYKRTALGRLGRKLKEDTDNIIDSIILKRREAFELSIKPLLGLSNFDSDKFISENKTKLTFIDVMLINKLPDGSPLPHEQVREEVMNLIFAGYDTTATTLAFALCNLAKYKEFQDKAYREQVDIFSDDPDRDPTLQDLNNMNYLTRFIKESMRIYPTIPQLSRHIVHDLTLSDGKVIPAGTNIILYIPGIHMHPKSFPNPKLFDPDRFSKPVHVYSYIPFSAGIRNCIGFNFAWMSIRAVLSKILRNYELVMEKPDHEPRPVNQILLESTNGFRVQFKKRNSS